MELVYCIRHKQSCEYSGEKSVYASAQSDQSLSFPPEETLATQRVPIKDSDQTAWMHRLIRAFDGLVLPAGYGA